MLKKIWILLLVLSVVSCKKNVQQTAIEQPKTGIYKTEGKRIWKGKLSIEYNPTLWSSRVDTSYEITFSNTIYVLDTLNISYSPEYIGNIYIDSKKLFITDIIYKNNVPLKYYFSEGSTPWSGGLMNYYYDLDSFSWDKHWITDSNNWRYSFSVHSP